MKFNEEYFRKYYARLIGFKITALEFVPDEFGGEPFPKFTATNAAGETINIEVSKDAEGNGAGYLFISQSQIPEINQ